ISMAQAMPASVAPAPGAAPKTAYKSELGRTDLFMAKAGSLKRNRENAQPARTAQSRTAPTAAVERVVGYSPEPQASPSANPKAPSVRLHLLSVQGNLDQAQIARALRALEPSLTDTLAPADEAKTVKVLLQVDAQGKILRAQFIDGAFGAAPLNRRLLNRLQTLKFEPPTDALPATVMLQVKTE
ncbi:MAG: hypothetical protein HGA76_02260, partial [Candidatus Firestonebacteria bacterium]|nr:hypothetical protein [Candidatus Firestonebacteria bacterium]